MPALWRDGRRYATNGEAACYDHYDQVFGSSPLYETVADVSSGNGPPAISSPAPGSGTAEGNTGFGRRAVREPRSDHQSQVRRQGEHRVQPLQPPARLDQQLEQLRPQAALAYTPNYIDLRPDAGNFPDRRNGVPDANPLRSSGALGLNDEHAFRFTGATLQWNVSGRRS
jgi:hypothetical protein